MYTLKKGIFLVAIDILIKNAICVSHNGTEPSDIAIKDDIIVAIGQFGDTDAGEIIDATGLHLLPGVIDTQVHFREPGAETKEDLESGSRAAVMGGVTAVFEMPNTKPSTSTAEALQDKVNRATNRMWCDFAFYMGATADNAHQLDKLERVPGCCGIKIFMGSSTGDLLVSDDQTLTKILGNGTRRIAIHAEDETRLIERQHLSQEGGVSQHPVWRDATTAYRATERILEIARKTGRRIHVLHITTEEEMALLAAYKDVASVEVTPQHLTLSAPATSTGDLLVSDDQTLTKILGNGTRRIAIHAEDETRLIERQHLSQEGGVSQHPVWRDATTAYRATERILEIARKTGRRIHVLHITTEEEMALLAAYKDVASVEVTPQHLTLSAPECYQELGTYAQMNPPIRGEEDRIGLWKALSVGIVDVLGSDHAPHEKELKAKDYPNTPSGMPGVQTLLPLMLDHVNKGLLTLEHLVDLTSASPARLFNIAGKGRLAVGYDADLTLVDLKKKWTIEEGWLQSKCGWSPFTGKQLTGKPVGTFVRGKKVMWEGKLADQATGQAMRFQDTLNG